MMAHSGEEGLVLRVLHVDDNAGDVRLVAEGLRELGIALEVYEAYQLLANCYVTKPVDLEGLFETIGAVGKYWLQLAKLPLAAT